MIRYGLLGKKLGHSYSPQIHKMLAGNEYGLFEKSPEELKSFLAGDEWSGLNVTIPYKKEVVQYCSALSDTAAAIGSVNTLIKRPDGTIYGDNTDVYGFACLLESLQIHVSGKKALVLGSGGASVSAQYVLEQHNAETVIISRSGENNYNNLERHADAYLIVNTTPVGMYPNTGASPVNLEMFPACQGVIDIVYNPARTELCLQAERLSIPYASGLLMLTAQAKKSSEQFIGHAIPDSEIERITSTLSAQMQNIILVGMPGSGKTTIATLLAEKTGRPLLDSDAEVCEATSTTIPTIFAERGEAGFRALETEALARIGNLSGTVISTGGGVITRECNYPLLHQNGIIFWIRRGIDKLDRSGRPLSENSDLHEMFRVREPLYRRFADYIIDNDGTPEETVNQILEALN